MGQAKASFSDSDGATSNVLLPATKIYCWLPFFAHRSHKIHFVVLLTTWISEMNQFFNQRRRIYIFPQIWPYLLQTPRVFLNYLYNMLLKFFHVPKYMMLFWFFFNPSASENM